MFNNLLLIVLISFNIVVFVNCIAPSCYVCNSATDDNCKILQPDLVVEKQCVNDDPYEPDTNVCFTLFDGTNVVRDCLFDVNPEFSIECENNVNCRPCNSDACNKDNIEPLQCIKCNSTADPNCATLKQSITTTESCEDNGDECFVGIFDGVTYRGCISAVNNVECPAGMCEKCLNKDKCNDAMYPDDRWSCHQCNENANCNDEQDHTNSYTCRNYNEAETCYIIGMGLYAARGCLSDSDEYSQHCIDNPDLCTMCSTETGCNRENAVVDTGKSCYYCDQTDPFCFAHVDAADVANDITVECKLFLKYEFHCYVHTSDGNITRDCLNRVGRISQPACNETGSNCLICDSDLCNNIPKLEPGDSCISCTSNNPNCTDDENILSLTIDCYSHPNRKGCYFMPGNIAKRGCVTNLADNIQLECDRNDLTCKKCFEENCNKKLDFTSCYECDSTVETDCITIGTNSSICYDYVDSCLVYVEEHGRTVRGCKNTLNTTCSRWNCSECFTNDCNGYFFPEDRQTCLKCTSATDKNCFEITEATAASHAVICQNYVSDDFCFTIVNEDRNLTRGCLSDQDIAAIECLNDDKFCVQCPRHNCNTRELKYEPTLSCIHCNQTNPKCAWGFDENDAQPCNTTIFFDGQEKCYTYQKDGQIERGCVLDDDTCLEDDAACTICGSYGCNSLHLTQAWCIVCDSSNIEEQFCNNEIEDGDLTLCSNGNQLYERRGCYTFNADNRIHRGCVSTLKEEDFVYCLNAGNINCDICYGDGCNNKEPNYASRLYYLSALSLMCISIFAKLIN